MTPNSLVMLASAAAVFVSAPVQADPFQWDMADVTTGALTLSDGTDVTFKAGHISQGAHIEVAIELTSGEVSIAQQIVHEMTDGAPRLSTDLGLIVTTWSIFPGGADEAFDVSRCWRFDASEKTFAETDCPTPR